MNLKQHLPPTLHNAAGTLIAAAALGLLSTPLLLFRSARVYAAAVLTYRLPVYLLGLLMLSTGIVILLLVRRLRAARQRINELTAQFAKKPKTKLVRVPRKRGWVDSWRL